MKRVALFFLTLAVTLVLHGQQQDLKKAQFVPITDKVATVELTSADVYVYRQANIAIGEVRILEFPDGVILSGEPVVGDTALLKVEVEPNPLIVKTWALLFQGVPEDQMYGLNSNIQLKTSAGITIIVNFIITSPDKASNRIVFTYPEFTKKQKDVQDQLSILKNKLQEEHKKKLSEVEKLVEQKKLETLTQNFAEFFSCETYKARDEKELVFLVSDRICKVGKDTILINFRIKNRMRSYFYLKEVKVYSVSDGAETPMEVYYWVDKYGIKFDELLNGAVGFQVKDYTPQYIIEITEEAGKTRVIRVTVGF